MQIKRTGQSRMNLRMVLSWLVLTLLLPGCDLSDPQGPASEWQRPEQQRLDALREKCDGPPWESAGLICPDDVVIVTRSDSTDSGD